MSTYTPDVWVVLELTSPKETIRKVFAGWYGGFAGSDSWKLNSGITQTRRSGDWLEFEGYSGSTYHCHAKSYKMSGLMHSVLARWMSQADKDGDVQIRILTFDEAVES